ncbi:uncharacterized protein [Macrobrachium rosenbergii]|uniref:uncharacterized protein n=1 Tax=Macrobrachium rosenbergii TaxID=79674 RepID=UPI0034D47096
MRLKIFCGGEVMNIVSAFAPKVGCTEEKNYSWNEIDGMMQDLEEHERAVVGAGLNGHVGGENGIIGRVHGSHGIGERNPEGESIMDFAMATDVAIVSTFFKKKMEHPNTYRSGGRCSQIDYSLYKKQRLLEVKNCKVVPGDHVAAPAQTFMYEMRKENQKKSSKKDQVVQVIKG